MPNIVVKVPKNAFPGEQRAALARALESAAAAAEQIPAEAKKRFLCWVLIEEIDSGNWTCGGVDVGPQLVPCVAIAYVPAGVLDGLSRALYVQSMHEAFKATLPAADKRQVVSSVVLHDVADATWGANGQLWQLADFVRASGYAHLQHLLAGA